MGEWFGGILILSFSAGPANSKVAQLKYYKFLIAVTDRAYTKSTLVGMSVG